MASIYPTSKGERTYRFHDFFLLWAGAAISLGEVLAGGILVPLGFTVGVAAILLGHLIGNTPLALGGIIGSRTGTPSMVALRPAFGLRGSHIAAVLNVLQLVGWTAIMVIIGGRAANEITRVVFGFDNASLWIVLVGAATTLWAALGHGTWRLLNKLAVALLLLLCLVVTYSVFAHESPSAMSAIPAAGGMTFGTGLDVVIAMPVSWLPLVCDYSRFARKGSRAFWGTWLGYFVASSWMFFVGLAAALAVGSWDPTPVMLALGLGAPAMAVVLLSTFTTGFMDVYSSGISALNIAPRLGLRPVVVATGLLGTVLALVFPIERYESFLLLIGAVFVPLFGVVLADFFILRRGRYDPSIIYGEGDGRRLPALNPWAVLSWAVGFAIYQAISPALPIADALGFSGLGASVPWLFASIPSMLLAGLVYLVSAKLARDSAPALAGERRPFN